ncbi:MAG TPA: TfoX/Sxy family protein [Candidatus Kapabacteria bacterium]|nr:TfoX/Sxy family protein [Candidatus Kapabacteria bacterium]
MGFNEKLVEKVRKALAKTPNVKEVKMSSGALFMVDGKVCVTVKNDDLSCRIDPVIYEKEVKKPGCGPMLMKGREFKGHITISEEGMKTKKQFDHWITLALEYNKVVKPTAKKKK